MLREYAQSIPRLEKTKNRRFSHKNPKMFDFRFNTPTSFPESESKKRFHASGMLQSILRPFPARIFMLYSFEYAPLLVILVIFNSHLVYSL